MSCQSSNISCRKWPSKSQSTFSSPIFYPEEREWTTKTILRGKSDVKEAGYLIVSCKSQFYHNMTNICSLRDPTPTLHCSAESEEYLIRPFFAALLNGSYCSSQSEHSQFPAWSGAPFVSRQPLFCLHWSVPRQIAASCLKDLMPTACIYRSRFRVLDLTEWQDIMERTHESMKVIFS